MSPSDDSRIPAVAVANVVEIFAAADEAIVDELGSQKHLSSSSRVPPAPSPSSCCLLTSAFPTSCGSAA